MSVNNPGVIYDATNSWNGYNHQGKISLWYAISEITKLYDSTISMDENKSVLSNYFLEIEYMEDFSIGKAENGIDSYISVHQVKNRADTNINAYESALLGLLSHLVEYPDIELAVLHTTAAIDDLSSKPLLEHIKGFASRSQYLVEIENEIINNRNEQEYREKLIECKKGRPSTLKSNLKNALLKKHSFFQDLTESNLDEAFDLYLADIDAEKKKLFSLSEMQMNKVSICKYTCNGNVTDYCCVDCAVIVLQDTIKKFYHKIDPKSYRDTVDFSQTSYLWMLGKLDDHIIQRNLHYDLYKTNPINRRISFSTIFDWLTSSKIDQQSTWYYLHHIKESFFKEIEQFCEKCNQRQSGCVHCDVVECKDKIGILDREEFKKFIHITTPMVSGEITMGTYHKYLQSGINDPFVKGLRDIPQKFSSSSGAISYKGVNNVKSALTTIAPKNTDDDKSIIASEILRNSNIYELLMDYNCLISKEIPIASIQSEQIFQTPRFDGTDISQESEHIMHCKDVSVIPLDDFIKELIDNMEEKPL